MLPAVLAILLSMVMQALLKALQSPTTSRLSPSFRDARIRQNQQIDKVTASISDPIPPTTAK